MTPRLFILTGASTCGKTTLLNSIAAGDGAHADSILRAVRAPKYSERNVRQKDGEVDDITTVPQIRLGEYDIAYVINSHKYGIKLEPIERLLESGSNAFVVVSDFRVVRQLKERFGRLAKALYVSSAIDPERLRRIQQERDGFRPTDQQKRVLAYHFARVNAGARLGWWDRVSNCMAELEADWRAYATDARSTEIRLAKVRAFHIRYIEHIQLFDHVILNYTENNPGEMTVQASNVIVGGDEFEKYKQERKTPPLFVVAAASGAGKGTLMEMLDLIGSDSVRVTSKLAQRAPDPFDKRDGMIALNRKPSDDPLEVPAWWASSMRECAERGEFPPEYDLQWEFHKLSSGRGTPYAVSSQEIQRHIDAGMPQILVSNMSQFKRFRERWPKNAVFVYLHRLASDHENRQFHLRKYVNNPHVAETKIAEKEEVHRTYIAQIAEFDHVLLNTSFEEDLYDQMFRLLEYYRVAR